MAVLEFVGKAVRQAWRDAARPLLVGLLVVDLGLIGWHLTGYFSQPTDAAGRDWLDHDPWSLSADRRLPELYGYVEQIAIGSFLLVLCLVTGRAVYFAWAALFGVVLVDDSFQLHERIGGTLVGWTGLPGRVLGVRTQDLGELTVWLVLAVLPLAAVVVAHRRGDRTTRHASLLIGLLTTFYVGFGVGVDVLHSFVRAPGPGAVVGAVEDGGELIALSVLVGVLAGMVRAQLRRGAADRVGPGAGAVPEPTLPGAALPR